jgi:ABC-type glycerol-3-phosphate transport system substrate-binding protein
MHRRARAPRAVFAIVAAFVLSFCVSTAHAADVDWASFADHDTVAVVTTDEDGDERETTIWVRVVDGQGYIRTSLRSAWGDNTERNPDIAIRVGPLDHRVRAALVTDDSEKQRIAAAFEEKYGNNFIIDWIRGDPRIFHLEPR